MSNNKITELTPEQEARLPEIAEEWIKIGLSTKTNREKAEALIPDVYRSGGHEPPKQIIWEESPYDGYQKAKELLDPGETPLPCYGSHDAHWLAFYAAFLEFGVEECEKLIPLMEIAKVTGWFFPMDEAVVMTPNPTFISIDERGRLSHRSRKAIEYPNGWGLYYIDGIAVSEDLVLHPENITVEQIDNERNQEIRRIMVDRYGWDPSKPDGGEPGVGKYLEDSGSEIVHKDEWGTLYRKEVNRDEDILAVRVKNSTAEPDGTYKYYFLRVPPDAGIETAHHAVAWTFGLEPEDYKPVVET